MENLNELESTRLEIQRRIDSGKTQEERNRLGQFSTPATLACDILEYSKSILPEHSKIRFMDPAFGTGSFYSALLRTFPKSRIENASGYEIDDEIGKRAIELWKDTPLKLIVSDFTKAKPPKTDEEKNNLLICNPPYVRHHHLSMEDKERLKKIVNKIGDINLNGLSGFYCYYLCISHNWMSDDGLACWLIPSEFMDVKYGMELKKYLLGRVTLLHIHRFNPKDLQFDDALVSSAVVWFKKSKPPSDHHVRFTYGGTLQNPEYEKNIPVDTLRSSSKWTKFPMAFSDNQSNDDEYDHFRLADLFTVKRGLATGDNSFFVLTEEEVSKHGIPSEYLRPILPSPRYLKTSRIEADEHGLPLLNEKLFLLSCDLPENDVRAKYPLLMKYLEKGIEKGVSERYLCKHREPWYSQENRPPALFLCTYMGRGDSNDGKHFRFILNKSNATAANSYLMLYPKPFVKKAFDEKPYLIEMMWHALNEIKQESLIGEGRVYGGGLHKIEPKELNNVPVDSIAPIFKKHKGKSIKVVRICDY